MIKINISVKCSDMFSADLYVDDKFKGTYDGYVPKFFPGTHFGDYVELEIDAETGQILNWRKPSAEDLKKLFGFSA